MALRTPVSLKARRDKIKREKRIQAGLATLFFTVLVAAISCLGVWIVKSGF